MTVSFVGLPGEGRASSDTLSLFNAVRAYSRGGESAVENPMRAPRQVTGFSKTAGTAQKALASVSAGINGYMEKASPRPRMQRMSNTVPQIADPIPPMPGFGSPGPGYFVVTALVTF